MRTITIDDGVFAKLQRRASETGLTISRWIEEAVGRATDAKRVVSSSRETFKLVTFGRGGRFSPHDVDKTSTLLEIEDIEQFGQPKR